MKAQYGPKLIYVSRILQSFGLGHHHMDFGPKSLLK